MNPWTVEEFFDFARNPAAQQLATLSSWPSRRRPLHRHTRREEVVGGVMAEACAA